MRNAVRYRLWFVLAAGLLSAGCAGQQTLYALPRQALSIELPCTDCTLLEFRGSDRRRMRDLNDGTSASYAYTTGTTYADQRRLRIPLLARVTGLEQTDRFTSPFDAAAYRVHGRLRDGQLTVALIDAGGRSLGQVELTPDGSAAHGDVMDGSLLLTARGQWDAESLAPDGGAQSGWKHYPAGRLDTITLADGGEVLIAAGQEVRHAHGVDFWRGQRWVARLPKGLSDADRSRLFLFYIGVAFGRDLLATYARIDDCLEDADYAPHEGCPARLILR